jgi:hypothetical protein
VADATTYTDIASAPLFIKLPNQRKGGYDDRHVTTFDIVPTVADGAGVSVPWRLEGRSVLRRGDPRPVVVHREQGREGPVFTTSLADYERARKRALARKTALFSHGVFGIGPRPDLIGKDVAALADRLAPAQATIGPELRSELTKVDTKGAFLPANIAGRVSGIPRGTPLALALNGKVAAVGWSCRLAGDKRIYFSFFAPPAAFHDGSNQAQVFKIER